MEKIYPDYQVKFRNKIYEAEVLPSDPDVGIFNTCWLFGDPDKDEDFCLYEDGTVMVNEKKVEESAILICKGEEFDLTQPTINEEVV